MILSDNETRVDLLNNEAIAKTVIALIKDSKDKPISIGIHGDWGAGKSSILEMIEQDIKELSKSDGKKYACIRFNGWKHQGFEDSKVALMSAIVSELAKDEGLLGRAQDIFKKLWKNINWMSAAKVVGKTALSVATGTTPLTILCSVYEGLKKATGSSDGVDKIVESVGGYLKEAKVTEDTSSNTEFSEFQKNFSELLKKANIEKLVVLIDDLDRCLPDVAIETLEAVRLFMFTGETAFVIAADEGMIRYAVKKHFPDAVDENNSNTAYSFANKYLEKLIQVPFRIPALGEVESCIYIMLLMVGAVLPENDEEYKKLITEGLNRIQKPWDVKLLTTTEVKEILGEEKYNKCSENVLIAVQICHLLAQNTDGNPRKIKRFINMLLLRYQVAQNRGFGEAVTMPILAKMMLAEYYMPQFYKELSNHLSADGRWPEVQDILADLKTTMEDKQPLPQRKRWYDLNDIWKWVKAEPMITDTDLRPYYYACKEKMDLISGIGVSGDINEIVDILMSGDFAIASHKTEIEKLKDQDAVRAFEIVSEKIMQGSNFAKKPDGIAGLIAITENKPILRGKLVSFISGLPKDKVGIWVVSGWDTAFPETCSERAKLDNYLNSLKTEGSQIVKAALNKTAN